MAVIGARIVVALTRHRHQKSMLMKGRPSFYVRRRAMQPPTGPQLPDSGAPDPDDARSGRTSPTGSRRNVAARAAHWSAHHRKTAIWGWIAFVAIAVVLGSAIGTNEITDVDQFNG